MKFIAALLMATFAASSGAAEVTVTQKNKAFSASSLTVKVGDKVSFRNEDAFVHNIFSLSEPAPFDLGTYPQGQSKSVVFSKPGKYEIECAIHPEMKLLITVAN